MSPPTVPASDPSITFRDVLGFRHYRNILLAQFASNIGTWMEMFAVQMYLAQLTGRLDDQGTLGVASQLPVFALGLVGGLVADRVNRKRMLIITQILASIVALGVAAVTLMTFENPRTAVHLLWTLSAVNGAVMAFNFPAWQVLTPRLVPRSHLLKAITLNGIQFNLARVLGPAIAGFVLAQAWMVHLGPSLTASPITVLLAYNALSFLIVASVVATTPSTPAPSKRDDSAWAQFSEAWRYLMVNRGPRAVLLAQVLLSMLAAPLVRLLSLFVINVYGLSTSAAEKAGGTLLAVQGVGAVIGGLTLRYIPSWYPKHHFIPVAVTGLGLSISLFAITPNLAWGYVAMALCGFFWLWAFNQSWAAMQLLAPDAMRGRVMSIVTTAGFGATAVGVFVAGHGGEWLKRSGMVSAASATVIAVGGLAVALLISGLVMMIWRVPEVDGQSRVPGAGGLAGVRGPSLGLWNAITAREHHPRRRKTPPAVDPVDMP
ncbi:MAG: MFS transporter [Phycisphaerales bacterium]|nr:MFS transporter [Phycisphaerales bacterium]